MKIYEHNLSDFESLDTLLGISDWTNINSLWGVSPTAPLHLGYDSLIILQREILKRKPHKHFLLLADMHSILTNGFSWQEIRKRCYYYEHYFRDVCKLSNADILLGSYFQTRTDYIEELYSTMGHLKHSLVKESIPTFKDKNIPLKASIMAYPIMQCLDIFSLQVNLVIAEEGQRKIYDLIRYFHDIKITRPGLETGFRTKNAEIHFVYIPTAHDIKGLSLNKSTANTRISIHDSKEVLNQKIDAMYCPIGNQLEIGKVNALLESFKFSIFPWITNEIVIQKEDGSNGIYNDYKSFENDYFMELIHPTTTKGILKELLWLRLNSTHYHLKGAIDSWIDWQKLGLNDPKKRRNIS